jgi:tetratricopeptide (TPR) repeat protein
MPLFFKKIIENEMNGKMVVQSSKIRRVLYFKNGMLQFAESNVPNERLGEILFNIGKITEHHFSEIEELCKNYNEKIGKLLVEKKILSSRDIYHALLYQIRINALNTFLMTHGDWEFIEGIPEIPNNLEENIKIQGIIAEGVRKLDDFGFFEDRFLTISPIPKTIPDYMYYLLTEEDIQLLKLLKPYKSFSNQEIYRVLQYREDTYFQKIVLFYLLDLIDFIAIKKNEENDYDLDEILQTFNQIQGKVTDYYQLLRIDKGATKEQIKQAYMDLSKVYYPVRTPDEFDSATKEKINIIFKEITLAFDTLIEEERRKEYDNMISQNLPNKKLRQLPSVSRVKELYRKALTVFKEEKYWEATVLLEELVRLEPDNANYLYKLGLCQCKIPSLNKQAETNLKRVADLEPWNADPIYALGVLCKQENLLEKSKKYFRQALEININHTKAGKLLSEMEAMEGKRKDIFSLFTKKKIK